MVGQVKPKTGIAIGVLTQVVPVDKDRGIHVNSIELNDNALAFLVGRNGKLFTVPGGASGGKASAHLADGRWAKRRGSAGEVFNAPVVRKVDLAPTGIVKLYVFRALRATPEKRPVVIEIFGSGVL